MTDHDRRGEGIRREVFGTWEGQPVERIILTNGFGLEVAIITLGASIQSVLVPDRGGRRADVALGHPDLDGYRAQRQFMGATVGRVANRIAGGRFMLDDSLVTGPTNNGANMLHGGDRGFDLALWTVLALDEGDEPGVTLGHVSPDGDEGFPGTLTVTATYRLGADNSLSVDYRAATDRTTVVNLSNHVYWNLAGEGAAEGAMDHRLTIYADHYLPTDAGAIPTGELRPVDGSPFDFRGARLIGADVRDAADDQIRIGRGYDHNWVIARAPSDDPRPAARLEDPASGRVMEILTNQPGLQFYSGNFFDGTSIGKAGRLYRMGDAVALEPQMFPDTPNRPEFGSLRLEPGQSYRNIIIWRFSTV